MLLTPTAEEILFTASILVSYAAETKKLAFKGLQAAKRASHVECDS